MVICEQQIQKERRQMAMAYFMVLSQHLPEGTQKTHKKLSTEEVSEPRLNPGVSVDKLRVLTT